ncbi:hypothetical protein GCM10027280_42150 [Micromonospora polyrhachis]
METGRSTGGIGNGTANLGTDGLRCVAVTASRTPTAPPTAVGNATPVIPPSPHRSNRRRDTLSLMDSKLEAGKGPGIRTSATFDYASGRTGGQPCAPRLR